MTRQTTPFELTVEESCASHSLNVIVLQKRIKELEAALRHIEYLDRPQVRGLPRRKTIQEIAQAALEGKYHGDH